MRKITQMILSIAVSIGAIFSGVQTTYAASASFNVTLDGNGGIKVTEDELVHELYYSTINPEKKIDLSNFKNTFARTGYSLAGWSWRKDNGVTFSTTQVLSTMDVDTELYDWDADNINLYAIWNGISYTIAYNGNGATEGSTENSSHRYGESKNLTANGYIKDGYDFKGWATTENGPVVYQDSESVINLTEEDNKTITLFAVWEKAKQKGDVEMTYSVNETAGSAIFHLNTTAINYTGKDNVNQDIGYTITITKGNYFVNNTNVEAVPYIVSTDNTINLSNLKGGDNVVTVTTDSSATRGTINLKQDSVINNAIKSKTAGTKIAGSYAGNATINFDFTIPQALTA